MPSHTDNEDYSKKDKALQDDPEEVGLADPADPRADIVAPDPVVPIADNDDVASEAAGSNKVTASESTWSKKVTDESEKPLSKKVTRRFRRSDVNDKETLRKIQQFVPPAILLPGPSLVGDFQPPLSPLLSTPSSAPIPNNDNAIPVWENGSDRLKIIFANEALELSGKRAVSWTLNLSPDRINEAQRHPKGFTKSLQRDLNRALERGLGYRPLYWFGVDVAERPSDRLHLQGGIAADDNELEAITVAMLHVGGEWASTRGEEHQLWLNPDRCDQGWAIYDIRNRGRVRKLIEGKTFAIAGPLRSEAKALYDAYRRIMRAA